MVSSKKLKKEKLAAKIINTLFKANILMILKQSIDFFITGTLISSYEEVLL